MADLADSHLLGQVQERFQLSESVVDSIRKAIDENGWSLEETLVEMGIVSSDGLGSVIGQLPTMAGAPTSDPESPIIEQNGDEFGESEPEDPADDLRAILLPPLEPGPNRYALAEEIDRGGMGRIVEATDKTLERTVAMKLLLGGTEQKIGWQLRFAQEAQITGQLQHPNIIPVYDLGQQEDGQLYFTMKLVEGQTLRDVFKGLRANDEDITRRYTRTHLLQVFQKICMAVAYAHSRSVVHRDLKPSNIMMGDYGEVLVMDWGLAKILKKAPTTGQKVRSHRDDMGRLATRQGEAIGTPGYMPPELALGQLHLVDERSDIFSLGAILYEMLTLRRPYSGRDAQTILQKMLRKPVTPARRRAADRNVPMDLEAACARCLERDVSKRYESVLELHHSVQRHLEDRAEAFDLPAVDSTGELDRHVQSYFECVEKVKQLTDILELKRAELAPWVGLQKRRRLRTIESNLRDLSEQLRERFSVATEVLRARIVRDPTDTIARTGLSQVTSREFMRAETMNDAVSLTHCRRILTTLNSCAELLRGDGTLQIETNPPGLSVKLYHMTEVDSVLTPIRRETLEVTPVTVEQLPIGPYLATIRGPNGRDVRTSFQLRRQEVYGMNVDTLPGQVAADGFVYVPKGKASVGFDYLAAWPVRAEDIHHEGFFIGRLPITIREYMRFLNAVARTDADTACKHTPRNPLTGELLLKQTGSAFFIPRTEFSGLAWDPNWPVFGVSREDVLMFSRWRGRRDGRSYRLPTDQEWEIAARGGDGRNFPWGDNWEASFCNSSAGQLGLPRLAPVGSHPNDQSPYGLMDLAGGVTEWSMSDVECGDVKMAICKGGRWNGSIRDARCASRHPMPADSVHLGVGFRLAYDLT